MPRALLAIVVAIAGPACERADRAARRPAELVEIELTGVTTAPRLRITVPRFGAHWSAFPALYRLQGGSLRDGFMTSITVGATGGCASPRCDREQVTETAGRRTQTCTTDRGVTVHVEHRGAPPLCCIASWTATGILTNEQHEIAAGIERACERLVTAPQQ